MEDKRIWRPDLFSAQVESEAMGIQQLPGAIYAASDQQGGVCREVERKGGEG